MKEYPINIIDTEEKSLIEISRFLEETFQKKGRFPLDFVRWQYAENPLGQMVGFNAWDGKQIISHFAGLPIRMNLFGKNRKGLLCINVSTNPEYRGKKLFTVLGQRTIDYAEENGFDFLMAVPNANSTHAFLKYFGFYLISPLTVKIGTRENIFPSKAHNCYKTWDDDQWKWRLSNPLNKYSYKDVPGILSTPIAPLIKTVSKADISESIRKNQTINIGFRPLNLYIGLGGDTSKGLYFNIPAIIKRPPFNFVFKDLSGEIPVITKDDIFLQLIDLDTI